MKLRHLALCLVLCLLLSACGIVLPADQTDAATTTTTAPVQTPPLSTPPDTTADSLLAAREAALDSLGNYDFANTVFVLATTQTARYGGSQNGDVLSVAAYERNRFLQDKYHAIVSVKSYENTDELFDDAVRTNLSGLYLADLYALSMGEVGRYLANGLLASVYNLPYLDFNAFYLKGAFTRESEIGTASYAFATENECLPADYPAVFFSREVTDYLKLDPYAAYDAQNFTWDTLFTMANQARASGFTGFSLAGADTLGIALPTLISRTTAAHVTTLLPDSAPKLDFNNRANTVFTLMEQCSSLFTPIKATDGVDLFAAGGVLFQIAPLGAVSDLATLSTGYGLLPLPKYSEMQANTSTVPTDRTTVLVLPRTTGDLSRVGRFASYFAAASYGHFTVAAADAWLVDALREERALASVYQIFASAMRVDFSDYFGNTASGNAGYDSLAAMLASGNQLLAEVYNGTTSAADAKVALQEKSAQLATLWKTLYPHLAQ